MKNKVFLGGTCGNSVWRNEIMSVLNIDYFNPVVEDWTSDCQIAEYNQKELFCNIHLYVITKEMQGVFSIAEVINSVHTKGKITILHVVPDGFEKHQIKSLQATCELVSKNGGIAYVDNEILRTARVINYAFSDIMTALTK